MGLGHDVRPPGWPARLPAALFGEYSREVREDGVLRSERHVLTPALYDLGDRWYVHLGDVAGLTAPRNRSVAELERSVGRLLGRLGYRRRGYGPT